MSTPEDPDATLKGIHPADLLARGLQSAKADTGNPLAWNPPSPEELAKLLPQYEIKKLIGVGGMGAVYQGMQAILERPVAIKLMPTEFSTNTEFIARFYREARMLAKLQHPNIVTIYDFGQTPEGYLYFVMEFVNGTDLDRIISSTALTTEQALELTIQICGALHYAHSQGVIHRDIKPANVLVTAEGNAKLADFGLARPVKDDAGMVTRTNVAMGTPAYMAPEQREGHADERADIYALGVMLYEMLTGKRPKGVFEPPSMKVRVDVRLDQVVIKAMQQEPERRYQHVSELKTEVERIRATPREDAAVPSHAEESETKPDGRTKRSQLSLFSWMAVIAVSLVAINSMLIWSGIGTHTAASKEDPIPRELTLVKADTASAKTTAGAGRSLSAINATKAQPFENSLGMKFVPVPITGGPTAGKRLLFSVWDTRVQDYEVFANETKREWPKPDFQQGPTHPAVMISWDDAQAFCHWLTERERKTGKLSTNNHYRLPTDHEWSCAVGIGQIETAEGIPESKSAKIKVLYWGTKWPAPKECGNFSPMLQVDEFNNTSPVGSFAANENGLYDMGGNVYQWCEDWFDTKQETRVTRGASWGFGYGTFESSYRGARQPHAKSDDGGGFRCVLETAVANSAAPADNSPVNPQKTDAIPPDINNGLVSWWKGEGDARDTAGANHGSLLKGASFGPGKHGQAFLFNTPGAHVSIPASMVPAFGRNRFSLALWVKFGAVGGEGNFLASQGADNHDVWAFCCKAGRLQFHVLGDTGIRLGSAEFIPEFGKWHHLAVARSGYTYRFYIDGAAAASESWPGKFSETAAAMTLGKTEQGSFEGLLDDVRVYNRALSATEIKALFEAP